MIGFRFPVSTAKLVKHKPMSEKAGMIRIIPIIGALFFPTAAIAEGLPPLPPILLNTSSVTCIKIADNGTVSDAFIVTSAGDAERDRAVIAWVKQLHWDAWKPGDESRNRWLPMPVAFGNVSPAPMPEHCEPPPIRS